MRIAISVGSIIKSVVSHLYKLITLEMRPTDARRQNEKKKLIYSMKDMPFEMNVKQTSKQVVSLLYISMCIAIIFITLLLLLAIKLGGVTTMIVYSFLRSVT